jgi:GntR family transcriptional regulator
MAIDLDSLHVDRFARTPMYHQVADWLRALIDDGELSPNESLPSEGKIAAAADVSKAVVREAMDVLSSEGKIVRRAGAATKVAAPPPVRLMSADRYVHAVEILREKGEHPASSSFTDDHGIDWSKYRIDFWPSKEKATHRDAELLEIPVGAWVLRRVMIKYADGVPIQIQRSAMPWDLAGGTPLADPGRQPWPGGTIAELWHVGYEWCKTVEDIGASTPSDEERRQLRMETPSPLLDVVRVFWAHPVGKPEVEARPLEASRVLMPANRNRLRHETSAS